MFSIEYLPNKLAGEKVVKIVRRDMVIFVKKILFLAILLLLPALFYSLVISGQYNFEPETTAYALGVLLTSAYYLFVWIFFFFSFVDYYLDVWIITNMRIIDIEQKGFFSRVISEQRLHRVQDTSSEMEGILATVFKYGDVHVQTAGAKERFEFKQVPEPDEIRGLINRLMEEDKKREHVA